MPRNDKVSDAAAATSAGETSPSTLVVRSTWTARIGTAVVGVFLAVFFTAVEIVVHNAPFSSAGLELLLVACVALGVVFLLQAWIYFRVGLVADTAALTMTLPRVFLTLLWPPLTTISIPWASIRSLTLRRRCVPVLLPKVGATVSLPWDFLIVDSDRGRVELRQNFFGFHDLTDLGEAIAARANRPLEMLER